MSAEWFFKLKEFDSLGKMKNTHLKAIKEQSERLDKLNVRRQNQLSEVSDLKSELLSVQQSYFETEKKLNTAEEQAQRLRDVGGDDSKIAKFVSEAQEHEGKLFEMLERTEAIQTSLEEAKTFLSGLEKTFLEIEAEVKSEILVEENALEQATMRMKLIEEELPSDFRNTLERTLKKNLAVGPFTRIDQGTCFFCRYKISRTEESEIDMQKNLKTCPQCTRIFLPFGT